MAKGRQERKERIPFGVVRKKMNLDIETEARLKKEGKKARWINDEDHGMRLKAAQDGGYEFVYAEGTQVGDLKEMQDNERRIRKLVGTNKDNLPKYAYLMAIPIKYYKEDQKKKEELNKQVDAAIIGGQPVGVDAHMNSDTARTYPKNIEYTP